MVPRSVLCGALLVFLAGCGGREDPVAPVEGQVTYQGRPLPGGTIVFTPDTERGGHGPQSWAPIGADGRFQLRTDDKAGAVIGWHRVTVAPGKDTVLPAKYRDPQLSKLHYEVRAGRLNECSLKLD